MALGSFVSSLGGIFGKKPKVPDYPTAQMQQITGQERAERQRLAGMFKPYAEQRTGEYQADVDAAKEEALGRGREQASSFLEQLDPLTSKIYQAQADQLKQSLYGAIPETTAAAREAGAAGGGLQRGIVQSQLANIPVQAASQYASGLTTLNVESLKAKQDALAKVYDNDTQMGMKLLGIDEDTAINILNTGNQADVNELNSLLDEAKNFATQQRGIATGQYSTSIAQAAQDAANQAAKWQNIGTAIDTGTDLVTQIASMGGSGNPTGGQQGGLVDLITRMFKAKAAGPDASAGMKA